MDELDLDRRNFITGALAVGAIAGATLGGAGDALAAKCPKFPKPKRDRTRAPFHILSETGIEAEAELDLLTVEADDFPTPAFIQFELFVDTYESGESVRTVTDKIESLTLIDGELHRPPICVVTWGQFRQFTCLVTEARPGYTMFLPDGTPVRAKVALTLQAQVECELRER